MFKREPDIVGTNASCDRHKGLRTLLRYFTNGERNPTRVAIAELFSLAHGQAADVLAIS